MNCKGQTEVFARIVGVYRPVQIWNPGKKSEFEDRKCFTNLNQKKAELTDIVQSVDCL